MTRSSGNVFANLGFNPDEAQNLLLRCNPCRYPGGVVHQAGAKGEGGSCQKSVPGFLKVNPKDGWPSVGGGVKCLDGSAVRV
jgi:hypothetical protein